MLITEAALNDSAERCGDRGDVEGVFGVRACRHRHLRAQFLVVDEAACRVHECVGVARRDDQPGTVVLDDPARKILFGNRPEQRPPSAMVGQHLRRHREHAGSRLEQDEQNIAGAEHRRQVGVRLKGEQLHFASVGHPLAEPVGADSLRRHDHPNVRSIGKRATEFEQHRRLVLEAQRPGVEQHGVPVVESVVHRPVVRPRHDRHFVDGRPVLDHRHAGFVDPPTPERAHEVVADHHDPGTGTRQELLDLLEHHADDRSDRSATTREVLTHRHAVDVLLPEHDRHSARQEVELDDERGDERSIGGHHDVGMLTFRQSTEPDAVAEFVAQTPQERILREVVTEIDTETGEAARLVVLADGTVRRLERRAVDVGHQMTARCERSRELHLERVTRKVMHEDPAARIGIAFTHRSYTTDDVGGRLTIHTPRNRVMRLAVCALTYHRPEGLRRLLDRLERLDVPDGHEMFVVIIDNDPEGSAREIVESAAAQVPWELLYEIELERGISAARNAAVRRGLDAGADAIVFIDDDEWPDADWLAEFIATQVATRGRRRHRSGAPGVRRPGADMGPRRRVLRPSAISPQLDDPVCHDVLGPDDAQLLRRASDSVRSRLRSVRRFGHPSLRRTARSRTHHGLVGPRHRLRGDPCESRRRGVAGPQGVSARTDAQSVAPASRPESRAVVPAGRPRAARVGCRLRRRGRRCHRRTASAGPRSPAGRPWCRHDHRAARSSIRRVPDDSRPMTPPIGAPAQSSAPTVSQCWRSRPISACRRSTSSR